jgi:uncharacterized protein (DUF1501 family)
MNDWSREQTRRLGRRELLGGGLAAAGAGVLVARATWSSLVADDIESGMPAGRPADASTGPAATENTTTTLPDHASRVLVVLQLGGGNDGLNTLIPTDGRYMDARPGLRVAEGDRVALAGQSRFGLHPALRELAPLWDAGRLAAINGLGFSDQSRSHFAAMDTWWHASTDHTMRTGWLGRWLDQQPDPGPLRAIALGGGSPALVGARSLSTVVLAPNGFSLRTPKGADAKTIADAFLATAAPLDHEPTRAAAQRAVPASVDAVQTLAAAKALGAGADDDGNPKNDGRITRLLATAAGIINLDLGTRIVLVATDGFDTHTDQGNRHPKLLTDLAVGMTRFAQALDEPHRDRVLVVTTSEFGRRVKENGSGTDHGNGSVQFLTGAGVTGRQIVGDVDLTKLDDGDLATSIDARSLYALALDWLSGDSASTDAVLGGQLDRYGLLRT